MKTAPVLGMKMLCCHYYYYYYYYYYLLTYLLTVSGFPYFFILAVPNHFRYPVSGQEPGSLTHRHRRLLTQKRIFRPAYYFTVGTNNAVKCYIISAVIWLDYLQSSVFISISQTQMKLEPPHLHKWSSPKRHFNFRIRSGKIMTSQSSQ